MTSRADDEEALPAHLCTCVRLKQNGRSLDTSLLADSPLSSRSDTWRHDEETFSDKKKKKSYTNSTSDSRAGAGSGSWSSDRSVCAEPSLRAEDSEPDRERALEEQGGGRRHQTATTQQDQELHTHTKRTSLRLIGPQQETDPLTRRSSRIQNQSQRAGGLLLDLCQTWRHTVSCCVNENISTCLQLAVSLA